MRNLAYLLSKKVKAKTLFLSPVPSVSSYFLTVNGKLKLKGRLRKRNLLVVRREPKEIMTRELENFVRGNLEKEILFLARKRGYSYMFCDRCSFIVECPRCSSLMTYSMFRELLYCSRCGYRHREVACPLCEAQLRSVGFGIEKVMEVIEREFGLRENFFFSSIPDVRDSKEIVVVVSADNILSVPSYYSEEEFFQYVFRAFQNAERTLFLQTVFPDHPAVESLKGLHPQEFLAKELRRRQEEKLPPFYRLFRVISTKDLRDLIAVRITENFQAQLRDSKWHYLLRLDRGDRRALRELESLAVDFRGMVQVLPE
jgi:primosomal protein N' (replication factor Y)